MDKLTAYKKFIEKCTKSPKSVNNYTDFKKINKWINYVDPHLNDILSIESSTVATLILEKLMSIETLPDEKDGTIFKSAGNAQYYNAFTTYIMFLNAIELSDELSGNKMKGIHSDNNLPLQQIFYGAPGTGKSHTVDSVCGVHKHYRTTFHPDSDYSTFVGCYKPTKESVKETIKSKETLKLEFESLGEVTAKNIVSFVGLNYVSFSSSQVLKEDWKYIFQKASDSENTINAYVPLGLETAGKLLENAGISTGQITYCFTPQAFTNAYLEAWKLYAKGEPVFLVIEEINRGNCAQIFGDLFQLLDRNEQGFSTYPIKPDTDLGKYIEADGELNVSGVVLKGKDVSSDINSGKVLVLPPNLYIWATMNTSDQSLFPIDSAFKRRWDWKYVPISDAGKGYHIDVNGNSYDWWSFLEKVNAIVEEMTSSEDKQLGYFFCKAEDGKITVEKFVGKVIFYLWNDVFKDYGFDRDEFKYEEDGKTKPMTFRKFFKADGTINETMAEKFLMNLEVEASKKTPNDVQAIESQNKSNGLKVSLDGVEINKSSSIDTFIEAWFIMGRKEVQDLHITIGSAKYELISDAQYTDGSKYAQSQRKVEDYWIVTHLDNNMKKNKLKEIAQSLNHQIVVTV